MQSFVIDLDLEICNQFFTFTWELAYSDLHVLLLCFIQIYPQAPIICKSFFVKRLTQKDGICIQREICQKIIALLKCFWKMV